MNARSSQSQLSAALPGRADSQDEVAIHGELSVRCPEIQVLSPRVIRLQDLNIREPRLEEAREIGLVMEFILVLVQMLATVLGFDDRVSGQDPVGLETTLDGAHQVAYLLLGEVLDRCIPDDVVELPFRNRSPDVAQDVLNVVRGTVLSCTGYRRRIEVDSCDGRGLVRVEVVGHEAIAAAQLKNLRQLIGSRGLQRERGIHPSFPRERRLSSRPLPVLVDEVIEILRVIRTPLDEILQPMRGGRGLARGPAQRPRNGN